MKEDYIKHITWEQVDEYLNNVVSQIDPHNYTGVYGIPRGGLVLASWLSHKLYLPLVFTPDERSIIVDDICDSGDAMRNCIEYYNLPDTCFTTTMYKGDKAPDHNLNYYYGIKGDNWIAFPWEQ